MKNREINREEPVISYKAGFFYFSDISQNRKGDTMALLFFIGLLLVGSACYLTIYMYRLANFEQVIEHTFEFENFPSNETIVIFFISDIHRRVISEEIIRKVKGKADFVLIGGDLAERKVPLNRVRDNLAKLKSVGPVYFVWGNNDYELDRHELDALFLQMNIHELLDTSVLFETNDGGKIRLLGIDFFDEEEQTGRLDLAMEEVEEDSFKILASHTPEIEKEIKKTDGIDLMLSGHTHGGQIRIFGMGKYKLGGISKKEDMTILTSNGYGTSLLPLRLVAKPETHLIRLKKGATS
jgi:predicted MPP superfamily phosphohydrolase